MGWFGEGILDGDDPMDYIATLREEVLGLHYEGDDEIVITAAILAEHADDIAAWCARQNDPVAFEVWAQCLTEADTHAITEDHRAAILQAIDADLARVDDQGWKDPAGRRFALRELREKIEVLGTGKVVRIATLRRDQLREQVTESMQFAMRGTTDPSVVQKAVARMLMDIEDGTDLSDFAHAAVAISAVGIALKQAVENGLDLREAVAVARERVGA